MTMAFTDFLNSRDDDANGFDSDTPRSGVATPQPDPSDKRLPGIMHSYFGQVGSGSSGSSASPNSGPLEIPVSGGEAESKTSFSRPEELEAAETLPPVTADSTDSASACPQTESEALPFSQNEQLGLLAPKLPRSSTLHSYPTPPASQTPSLHKLKLSDSGSEDEGKAAARIAPPPSRHHKSISESIPSSARRASLMNPLCNVLTTSNVHAADFSNPSDRNPATSPNTPSHSRLNSDFHESASYDRLKKLTDDAPRSKSIPPTPTRALSNQTVKSDASGGSDKANGQTAKANVETIPGAASLSPPTGAPAPAPKGKLTVKIAEARGLRKSRDPYVVAVFQRNELVSKGPLPSDIDENEDPTSSPMGGIPIARSGSDSGRPMAIPMKSRQSSNTSLSDYRDFKSKGRKSMTNPKWDTEAVL